MLEEIGAEQAAEVAERMAQVLTRPLTLEGQELVVTGSIGIAVCTTAVQTPDDLLRAADIAMYRAKRRGKAGYEIFDASMSA